MHGRLPRFAIVNPLTLVGKELRSILHERGALFSDIELIDTTGESEGTLTDVPEEATVIQPASAAAFAGADLVFFCGSGIDDDQWVEQLEEARVIDLTGSLANGSPVVAGVNIDSTPESGVISSPHPATVALALLLVAVRQIGTLESANATVLLSASLHEQKGIDELLGQTIATLNMKNQPREVFDRQLAFNLYPSPDASLLEARIARELSELLGTRPAMAISAIQATTFHGISMSVWLRFEEPADAAALRAALGRSAAIELREQDGGSSNLDSAGIDEILIGRVQEHAHDPHAVTLFISVDNLRRGSALNAVLIAEEITTRVTN